jgi:D-glycerate 3-kinase
LLASCAADRSLSLALSDEQLAFLATQFLQDRLKASAFGITPQNVTGYLLKHLELLSVVYPALITAQPAFSRDRTLDTLWNLWLPLATWLAAKRSVLQRPLVQGILGGQGAGKTTLAIALKLILASMGLSCIGISIDDLYKTHAEREKLKQQDPRLIWRGPPGTHDVGLGIDLLDRLRQSPQTTVLIPRFDKSKYGGDGDRTEPEVVTGADIILFEGWFMGVRPIDPAVFDAAPAPIVTEADRQFAIDINERLQAYLPLWERLDSLMLLYPSDYRFSKQWRQQAEREMTAKGVDGMSDAEVSDFVDYFWRALHPELFIKPLMRDPALSDLVVEINFEHQPEQVYSPRDRQF